MFSATRHLGLVVFLLLLLSGIALLVSVFQTFPNISTADKAQLRYPRSLDDAKLLGRIMERYTSAHYWPVLGGFCLLYWFLQAFTIPGSIFLSFVGGALFGLPTGMMVVCTAATLGATSAYMLSYFLVGYLVQRWAPNKLDVFAEQVRRNRSKLWSYLLFLRISPLLPNWFVNLASPLLDVPILPFMGATFVGIIPQTFIAVQAGLTLQEMASPNEVLSIRNIALLFGLAGLALLPTWAPFQVDRRVAWLSPLSAKVVMKRGIKALFGYRRAKQC